jgi:hypothetical protein
MQAQLTDMSLLLAFLNGEIASVNGSLFASVFLPAFCENLLRKYQKSLKRNFFI